jgi:hypothetical protein
MLYRPTSTNLGSPFSLREKVRMRGIKSTTFVDDCDSDPLTPTLSRREREPDRDLEAYPKFQICLGVDSPLSLESMS